MNLLASISLVLRVFVNTRVVWCSSIRRRMARSLAETSGWVKRVVAVSKSSASGSGNIISNRVSLRAET